VYRILVKKYSVLLVPMTIKFYVAFQMILLKSKKIPLCYK